MAEIFVIRGWTPDAAAAEIRSKVPCFPAGMDNASYLQVRKSVREEIVRLRIPTIRPFTSAVLYCLYKDEIFQGVTLPDYHVSDVKLYREWSKDREGSTPLPPNIKVTVHNAGSGGTNGRHFADLSGMGLRPGMFKPQVEPIELWALKASAQSLFSSQLGKEPTMITKTPVFEKRVFINGQAAASMTDDQLFEVIENLEREVARLDAIQAKPEKLGKKITKLEKAIDRIKAYVDAR